MKFQLLVVLFCLYIQHAYGTKICASGYHMNNNKCWKIMDDGHSRDVAHNKCGQDGGALLSMPESSNDNNALRSFVQNAGHSQIWLGLKCYGTQKSKCQFDNLDSDTGYSNFGSGSPNSNDNCVAFTANSGQWTSKPCDGSLAFVCELPTTTKDCGSNCGVNFNGYCYHLVQSSKKFTDAQNHCAGMGTNMVSIHNVLEYQFVAQLFHDKGYFWLGGKMPTNNHIQWLDGTPQDFSPETRELDGDCMQFEVLANGNSGKWLGKNCNGYSNKFICKRAVNAC